MGQDYTACLACQEQKKVLTSVEQSQRYEGIWTFERDVCLHAASLLLDRIAQYRPELASKVKKAKKQYCLTSTSSIPPCLSCNLGCLASDW